MSPDYYSYSIEYPINLPALEFRLFGSGNETRLFEYDIRCSTVYLLPDRDFRVSNSGNRLIR